MLVHQSVCILVPVCVTITITLVTFTLSISRPTVRCLREAKKMKREAATLQELRSALSVFDMIICGIFSHTVGLQLLTWTDCKVASDNLLSFRYGAMLPWPPRSLLPPLPPIILLQLSKTRPLLRLLWRRRQQAPPKAYTLSLYFTPSIFNAPQSTNTS